MPIGHDGEQGDARRGKRKVQRQFRRRLAHAKTARDPPACRSRLAETSRTEERLRISRDLHDSLAHALTRILDVEAPTSVLIFARTRLEVDELAEALAGRGYDTAALHGGLVPPERRPLNKYVPAFEAWQCPADKGDSLWKAQFPRGVKTCSDAWGYRSTGATCTPPSTSAAGGSRSAASCAQPLQRRAEPRGARTTRDIPAPTCGSSSRRTAR